MGKDITQMQLSQFAEYQADSLGFHHLELNYVPAAFIHVLVSHLALSTMQKWCSKSGAYSA